MSTDKPWIADLRAKYGDHVADTAKATAAAMPPLTDDQVAKLRALFATAHQARLNKVGSTSIRDDNGNAPG